MKAQDEKICFRCGENGAEDPLEKHHIFGAAYRKKCEKYGLTVHLCGEKCHRNGKESVHQNAETALLIKQYGQSKVMREQGWSLERFRAEFGKNYLPTVTVLEVLPGEIPRFRELVRTAWELRREIGEDYEIMPINKSDAVIYSPTGCEANFTAKGMLLSGKCFICGIDGGEIRDIKNADRYIEMLCEV